MSEISKTISELTKKLDNYDNLDFLHFMEKLQEEFEKAEKITNNATTFGGDAAVSQKIVKMLINFDTNIKKVIDNIDKTIEVRKAKDEKDKKRLEERLENKKNRR